jgi:hypothetical protein
MQAQCDGNANQNQNQKLISKRAVLSVESAAPKTAPTSDKTVADFVGEFDALWGIWKKPGPRNLAEGYFCEEIASGVSVSTIAAGLRGWASWYESSSSWRYCQQNLAMAIHDRTWLTAPPQDKPNGKNNYAAFRSPAQEALNGAPAEEYISCDEAERNLRAKGLLP